MSAKGFNRVTDKYIKTRLGLVPSFNYVRLFRARPYAQDKNLVCDYYEQGKCSIWKNRPSVCRDYDCTKKSEMEFNNQQIEHSLAQAVLFEMGFTLPEVKFEIEFYNKLIDDADGVCYPYEVSFEFYQKCSKKYLEVKDWSQWLGQNEIIKIQELELR